MASEKAKQLARQQKEAVKAEKLRRKNSTDPKDWGAVRQIRETYRLASEHDSKLPLFVFGVAALVIIIGVVLGLLIQPWWMWTLFGVAFAIPAAMFVLLQRSKRAAYSRFEGQAGSGEVALSNLGKKWSSTPAIAFTKSADVVHRAVGPGGLFLIGEGDANRVRALLATESKRHEQASRLIKPITIVMGEGKNQVPLRDLAAHLKKQPKMLDDAQISEINGRLRGLDAMRPKIPIPKGPMPTRVSRSAMRGR